MEADCKDHPSTLSSTSLSLMVDITQLLGTLSNQISTLDRSLRAQLHENELKILQDHEEFKINVKAEIDDLRRLILTNQNVSMSANTSSNPPVVITSSPPVVNPSPTLGSTVTPPIISPPSPLPGNSQSQMMAMMVESFTKLSTALTEKIY
jgi:hypothetical protein